MLASSSQLATSSRSHSARGGTRKDGGIVRLGWVAVRFFVICLVIVMFNFFPDRIGVVRSLYDPESFVSLLGPGFGDHLPWLNLLLGLAMVIQVLQVYYRRRRNMGLWDFALNFVGAYVLGRMVLGGSLLIYPPLSMLLKLLLAMTVVGMTVASVRKLSDLLRIEPGATEPHMV